MWLRRLFKGSRKPEVDEGQDPMINQGVYYLYVIITLQVVLVFAIVAVIMVIGKVLATPLWVFLMAVLAGFVGCAYIYRKAKRQFEKLRDTIKQVDLSDRNYEISFMGGVLTMRVEHNSRRLLQAPANPLLDTEPVETSAAR